MLNERVRGEHRNVERSRAASSSDRKGKLLKDKLTSHRSSTFRDARLGGDAESGSVAGHSGSVQRLVKLRQRQSKKSFNLGKEEELQHGGRPLSSLNDAELRASAVGDDEDGEGWATATVDDIIQQGRQRKEDAAREREELEKQRGELDKEFSNILDELKLNFRPPKALQPIERVEPDSYDKLLKELIFDRKAVATERTKTPEEIAREKAEKLEALERQRLARADGLTEDLDDAASGEAESDAGPVAASEGAEEGEEEEELEEDAEEADGAVEAAKEEVEGENDVDEDDRLGEDCIKLLTAEEAEAPYRNYMKNGKGEEGLPFAPECPTDRLAVEKLLENRAPQTCLKLVQRVRTRTASALGLENRKKLESFFLALLDFSINIMARSDGDISARGMQVVYALRRPLLELANEFPSEATKYFLELLEDLGPESAPRARELCALKLVPLIFPVTDFQHPVVTPATLLADHWASQLAHLGENITDLVSEGSMLVAVLYELLSPGRKFCTSFFQLGAALLDSCAASLQQGRQQCGGAAVDLAELLGKALKAMAEHEPAAAMMVFQAILRPCLSRLPRKNASIEKAVQAINEAVAATGSMKPLTLFEEGAVQIKMLDPIFHEEGDRPMQRGMDVSETKQLQRRLNHERRQAARQLARDAAVVQQLQHQKGEVKRKARQNERKRVRQMMETEKQELKKMATEYDKSMNTTFGSFSKTKERKKANRRMAGNATAENPKQPKAKENSMAKAAAKSDAAPKTSKKSTKGGKRKARRL